MTPPDALRDLELLVQSRYGLVHLETDEEDRAEVLLRHVAGRCRAQFYTWTRTRGLRCPDLPDQAFEGTRDAAAALKLVESSRFPALYLFLGLGDLLENEDLVARLKDAVNALASQSAALVVCGEGFSLPPALRPLCATLRLPSLQPEDYRDLLGRIVRDLSARMAVQVEMNASDVNRVVNGLRGLTLLEAEKVLTRAIVEDGKLSPEDIRHVIEAKKAVVEREGLLEYYPAEERMSEIADLAGLKGWLAKRRTILDDPKKAASFGLTFPKGILLVGVQGCGKSLCAKAVAMEWGLPLLKLDPSNLYNKFIGDSEKNFKRAMRTSERLAPVILWIDEIEKAFATAGSELDGGTTQRIFGSFLAWMQDRRGDVFVVATANDIERLPPEFIRKGRFDEIFFVDLPDDGARRAVFEIHLRRRGKDPAAFEMGPLVEATRGFSGAEIEQALVSSLYTAFSEKRDLTTRLLLDEIARTRPLSKTMAEKVSALREWARDRTASAQ